MVPIQPGLARRRRNIALSRVGAFAKEVLFRLLEQVLTRARIGHVEAVLVDQHGLLFEPALPRFLRYRFIDPLAKFSRQRGEVESFGFLAELRALNHSGHLSFSCSGLSGRFVRAAQGVLGGWCETSPKRVFKAASSARAICAASYKGG